MRNETAAIAAKSSPGVIAVAYTYIIGALPDIITIATATYMVTQACLGIWRVIEKLKETKKCG